MAVGITLDVVNGVSVNGSKEAFRDDYSKLGVGNISDQDRNAIGILGLLYYLAALGGTNYKTNHAGLIQNATVYIGGISMIDPVTHRAVEYWNTGKQNGSGLSSDVPTLLKEARDLADLPADTQERILAYLRIAVQT